MAERIERTEIATLTSSLVDQLRREIVSGAFKPGEKLKVREMAKRFEVGISPVREALNRLSSDRLVVFSDHRGFSVATIGSKELDELVLARCWINEKALRESIARGGKDWEESLVLAYHRLSKAPRSKEADPDGNLNWDIAHRAFHRALIGDCGSSWIVDYCDRLFDMADLYRSVARTAPAHARRQRDREHKEMMEAAVERRADDAVELLMLHFTKTADNCRQALQIMEQEIRPSRRSRRFSRIEA